MRKLFLFAGSLALSATLCAQSQLTTTFANNNAGSVGGAVYFDLQVNVGLGITALDLNLNSASGVAGGIDVYTTPGTYLGNEANQSVWTMVGSGTATSLGPGVPTPVTLNAPIVLSPGTYGVAFVGVGLAHAYTNGTGTNQTYANADMTLTAGSALNTAFTGSPFTPRVVNTTIYYSRASGYATVTPFGTGCNDNTVSFYESFPVGTFDLGSASSTNVVQLLPTSSGYVVAPGASAWYTPTSTNLALADDAISSPQVLPFNLNYPGGSTNSIIIESNGNIWLQPPAHTSFICDTTAGALLSRGPVVSAFYDDLDPTAGGTIQYDVDPSGQTVYVTWTTVPIFSAGASLNTFQVAIHSTGVIELRYQAMDSTGSWTSTLTGFSPGMNNRDPGSIDISASMPFSTQTDTTPLGLSGSGRPVLGSTSFGVSIDDIPATSSVGVVLLGLTQYSPGISLTPVGMPGCLLYASADAQLVTALSGSSTTVTVGIPNNPLLAGGHVFAQGGALDPSANALGVLVSNGLDLQLDAQ